MENDRLGTQKHKIGHLVRLKTPNSAHPDNVRDPVARGRWWGTLPDPQRQGFNGCGGQVCKATVGVTEISALARIHESSSSTVSFVGLLKCSQLEMRLKLGILALFLQELDCESLHVKMTQCVFGSW